VIELIDRFTDLKAPEYAFAWKAALQDLVYLPGHNSHLETE